MKNFKKLFAMVLAFVMVIGLVQITPAEAKAKQLLGVPIQMNGSGWFEDLIYGWYQDEGFVPKTDATYSVSYEMYVPIRAFDEWMEGSIDPEGGWAEEDDPAGKLCIMPYIYLYSETKHMDIRIEGFNEWSVNHYLKGGDEIILDGLWTPETGSLTPDDVEGKGVMTAKVVGDMIKITVKDLKAAAQVINYYSEENNWEPAAYEDEFDGTEDMLFAFFFGQWIGGQPIETLYVTSASIKMNGKTIWKSNVETSGLEWPAGNTTYATGETGVNDEGEEVALFDTFEHKAVPFNTSYLKLAKDKVEVKAKKSASVKVTTMNTTDVSGEGFGEDDERFPVTMKNADKVTVKTSDKKIATVSYKNGKVKIKGKKKGTATVTVSANGIDKTIAVTVK